MCIGFEVVLIVVDVNFLVCCEVFICVGMVCIVCDLLMGFVGIVEYLFGSGGCFCFVLCGFVGRGGLLSYGFFCV